MVLTQVEAYMTYRDDISRDRCLEGQPLMRILRTLMLSLTPWF